jgi:hypothetical protein
MKIDRKNRKKSTDITDSNRKRFIVSLSEFVFEVHITSGDGAGRCGRRYFRMISFLNYTSALTKTERQLPHVHLTFFSPRVFQSGFSFLFSGVQDTPRPGVLVGV